MVSPTTQKIFIVLVVLLLLGFLGYKMFTKEPVSSITNSTIASSTQPVGQDIITLVEQLKSITIDQNFFSSSIFNNLTDFTQAIFPENSGRLNPFSAIGSDSATVFATSTGTR